MQGRLSENPGLRSLASRRVVPYAPLIFERWRRNPSGNPPMPRKLSRLLTVRAIRHTMILAVHSRTVAGRHS
jgi:hypothetical protein